jgi:hypothetical protein
MVCLHGLASAVKENQISRGFNDFVVCIRQSDGNLVAISDFVKKTYIQLKKTFANALMIHSDI